MAVIKSVSPLIKTVQLTKIFHQNLTFTVTYQSYAKDLSSELIAPLRQKIAQVLKTKFNSDLVGELG